MAHTFSVYKTLLPYLYRYRSRYVWGLLCLIAVDAAQVIIPLFLQRAIDLIASGNFTMRETMGLAAAMVGLMSVISGGRFLWRYFIHGASRHIETEMRASLFEHLLTLSYDFYQKSKIGDLMARATNDLNTVRMAIGWGLVALIDGTVMAVSILVIIFISDARAAAFAVLPLPLVTLLIIFFGKLIGKRFQRAQEAYSAMSGTVQETFAGIRVVKSFVKEWWFMRKFADTNDEYRNANMELVKLYGVFFPLISFFSGLTSIILLLIGGFRVIEGYMSPGQLTALFRYVQMLIWPLMGAGFMVNMIQRGAVSLQRVNELMETVPLIVSPPKPLIPPVSALRTPFIEMRRLTFAYADAPVLEDISLTVGEGEWLGMLGRTGSGKSTLIKLLTRMLEPPPGTVFVKGLDVRDWDLKALRNLFGVTPQDSYLFSDSIRRNIAYGLDEGDALEQRVTQAAFLSALDQDIASFTSGAYDAVVGERGLTLSGGQKQRVSLSRALIKECEALILDDSLSAVDAETEKRILARLFEAARGKAVIIISHRVSTLASADKVLVLDKGRVAEYGTPIQCAAAGGFYAKTAALQQLEQAADGGSGGF